MNRPPLPFGDKTRAGLNRRRAQGYPPEITVGKTTEGEDMDRVVFSDKLQTLSRYNFFKEGSAALKEEAMAKAVDVRVPSGTTLFDRGGRCSGVALIGKGSVRVFIANEAGREMTLYHVGPGQTCPVNLLSSLLDMITPAKAVAECDLDVCMLPAAQVKLWMEDQAPVRRFVLQAMATRLVDIMSHAEEVNFGRLDRRLVDFLCRRFCESTSRPPTIVATHERIAFELSTAREVVSRLLRDFERHGAVDLGRGRITLKDVELLQKMRD